MTKRIALLVVVPLLSAFVGLASGCASSGYVFADEIAQGKSSQQLERLGWVFGDLTTIEELEGLPDSDTYAGRNWQQFKVLLQPGDELRYVEYKAEAGVAIFRRQMYVASFLPVVVLH